MNKLQIHNVSGLTRYAIFNGVVSREPVMKLDGLSPVPVAILEREFRVVMRA